MPLQKAKNKFTTVIIGGSLIRAIIEASRRIDPEATDRRAQQGRRISSWNDLDGMEFPGRLGIAKKSFEKDGREYWNNRISSVVPCTDKEFAQLVQGGEFITDGPVTGPAQNKPRRQDDASRRQDEIPPANGPQYGEGGVFPGKEGYAEGSYDDVPF